jgi:hypothetical protein
MIGPVAILKMAYPGDMDRPIPVAARFILRFFLRSERLDLGSIYYHNEV